MGWTNCFRNHGQCVNVQKYSVSDLKRLKHVLDVLQCSVEWSVGDSQVPRALIKKLHEVKCRVHIVFKRTWFDIHLHKTSVTFG